MIFRFAQPEAFLLIIFVLLALLLRRRWRAKRPVFFSYSNVDLVKDLPRGWRWRWRAVPDLLLLAVFACLILAFARPQQGNAREIIEAEGVDIVLALDISRSMDAVDMDGQTRLEAAKAVISDFIDGRVYDRVGLVVFAGNAYHLVPPTLDYRTLQGVLRQVKLAHDLDLPDGTAIGIGLAAAGNMLRDSEASSQIIILLTDGANTVETLSPITAVGAIAALDMRVHTIGLGSLIEQSEEGDVTGVPLGQMVLDSNGELLLITEGLDEESLQAIATIGGGQYFRAATLDDLQAVYQQIDALERTPFSRLTQIDWRDQPALPLLLALVLLLCERWLRGVIYGTAL